MTEEVGMLYNSPVSFKECVCFSYFSHCCDQGRGLRRERFIRGRSDREYSPSRRGRHGGRNARQLGRIASVVREQKAMYAGGQLSSWFLSSAGPQPMES